MLESVGGSHSGQRFLKGAPDIGAPGLRLTAAAAVQHRIYNKLDWFRFEA